MHSGPDLIDRRQRLAACLLLSAVELPAEAGQVARLWMSAAKVCPGVSVAEARLGHRREALEAARDLIEDLLSEAVP
jgi:hypothetical protein